MESVDLYFTQTTWALPLWKSWFSYCVYIGYAQIKLVDVYNVLHYPFIIESSVAHICAYISLPHI